ncbi:MAG: hypothetical protein JWN78_1778 [Bacteroidota bacterium]|nr:hypothetical protein [Bacteroidota bacterium]
MHALNNRLLSLLAVSYNTFFEKSETNRMDSLQYLLFINYK